MVNFKSFTEVVLDSNAIHVTEENISKLLGYDEPGADEFVTDIIRLSIRVTYSHIQPKGGFVIVPVTKIIPSEGLVVLSNQVLNVGKRIAGQLKNSEYLAIFIGTIGTGVEKLSERYFKDKDMLEGYIYNLIGSEAAEEVAELIHQNVRQNVGEQGLKITNRFSPGYCSWDVAEQFKLFPYFGSEFCDVTLTDSALMHPVKSVSGVIGIGRDVMYKDYSCEQCGQPNCLFSKLKKK